jgi:hypothetical protein
MDRKHMTTREKLELMKEIAQRNEQRRKEFVDQEKRNKKLLEMLERGVISEEDFLKYYKK